MLDNFINKANLIHNNKYDYSLVDYINNKTKIKIICHIHGIFEQTPNNHLNGNKCRICSRNNYKNSLYKKKEKEFIEESKILNGDDYDYSLVDYKGNKNKVKLICKRCDNIFEQTPNNHISKKHGCPKCSVYRKSNTKEFIKNAIKVHGNKYDYSLVDYINNKTKIKIICHIHGEFLISPNKHIRGQKCKYCSFKNIFNTEDFIKKSKEIHGEIYSYEDSVYEFSVIPVKIFCNRCNKYFYQLPISHIRGHGCSNCCKSSGEIIIEKFLSEKNIKFKTQKKFDGCENKRKLRFDFYLPEYNICIEYDGIQHFEPLKHFGGNTGFEYIKLLDNIKNEFCEKNDIKLLRISYKDNIDKIIKKELIYESRYI